MATTGQTINDRLNAVRYALVGQGLARTVCKATTEEVLGPKKKHIEYLLACTNEPNVSIPQLANLLIERSAHTNWAVVFKSLITMHHLMSYGNERFTQYLATSNYSFELADFMDRTTPQGYNMSSFVRKYAKYINEKAISYRTLAIDLCKIRSGSENALRTMNMDNLSKTLPIVQSQFDSLLDFSAESRDLNNGIIMSAFRLLYKDLVKLYVAYQEAIINLLERYFKLSRKKTREAFEMYKKYLARMDKVAGFLRVVEAVGLDKSEMPDLTKSPASILKLLEDHLAQLEAKKRGTTPANEDDEPATTVGDGNNENEPDTKVISDQLGGSEESATSKDAAEPVPPQLQPKAASPAKAVPSGVNAAGGSTPVAHPTVTTPSAPDSAAGVATATASEKQTPPKKPARPSPKTSPKVSPSSSGFSRPAPPRQSSPAAATSPSVPAERKADLPERPAKPPSRPPPPTAAPAPASSSSPKSETPAGSSSQPADHSQHAQDKVVAHSPPPHPPPPHPHPPTAAAAAAQSVVAAPTPQRQPSPVSEPTPAAVVQAPHVSEPTPAPSAPQDTTTTTINTVSATNGDAVDSAASSSEGGAAAPASSASCSALAANSEATVGNEATNNVVAAEVGHQAQDLETNHVNDVTNNNNNVERAALEEEMPPPPPPIEDDDIEVGAGAAADEVEVHQVFDPVQGQAAEFDPVVNGENGNSAE